MAIQNFIPAVWSAQLQESLKKSLVYGMVVNRDYEGEIKAAGDSVKINSIGNITIVDYAKNTDLAAPEQLNGAQTTLLIDQAKAFNFLVDDVDAAQANTAVMQGAMAQAAYNLADVADKFIAGLFATAGSSIGDDAAPIALTALNVYDQIIDLGVALDEKDAPSNDRFIVVPSFVAGLLQKNDMFVRANAGVTISGLIGEVAGFQVYKSNNVSNTAGAKYKIMAGQKGAVSFAEQIAAVEAYRPESRFADAVKGLHLYGAKVVRPNALAVLTANKG